MPPDSYTPTFDPKLSGLTPHQLLNKADRCRGTSEYHQNRGCPQTGLDFARCADWYERETEERWISARPPTVRIHRDGYVTAPGSRLAYLDFVGVQKWAG